MVKIENLSGENWEALHDLCLGIHLDGECYAFAIAVSRGTNSPIFGLIEGKVIRHALVKSENGKFFDCRGYLDDKEIGEPFGMSIPYDLRQVDEEDLFRVRPIEDISITRAGWMAQNLWPELPWNEASWRAKATRFMEDLDALCQKHGVWIRAPYPASLPILEPAHGDENFVMKPALTGQYFFDRYLSGQ